MTDTLVLVVDDGAEFLDFMMTLLSEEGYRVTTARTFGAARDMLAVKLPDVVICDARLPDAEPLAVLDLLHDDPKTRAIPVLVCTAGGDEISARAEELRARGIEVLAKPFDIDDLLAWLDKLSARAHRRAPTPAAETGS